MPDAPAPAPAPEQELDQEPGLRDLLTDVLACMEDVQLAEMWSQGVFINRRHGLAVVVVVLQS